MTPSHDRTYGLHLRSRLRSTFTSTVRLLSASWSSRALAAGLLVGTLPLAACSPTAERSPDEGSTKVSLGTASSSPNGSSGSPGETGGDYKPIGAEANNSWVRKMVDCLHEAGFSAEAFESSQGLLGFQNTAATQQVEAWSKGIARCETKVGAAPELPRFTPEQLGRLYDFYVRQRDCLTVEGFTISEPPSRDTFVATYYSSDPWGPYADVGRISPTTLSELETKCPQQPTAEDLR